MGELSGKRWPGVIAVLLSATCFALTSILLKTAFRLGLSPLETLALQSWLASFLLLGYALFFKRDLFKISGKTMLALACQGIIGSLGTSIFYAYALLKLPVSVAILLLYLYPGLVFLSELLFWHKRVDALEILALFLTLAGTALASGIFSGVGEVPWQGILLGLASALAYTIFNVVGEIALREVSPLGAMSFSQWFSSLGLFLYLRGAGIHIPWQETDIWLIGIALATVASILPFYLILVGIQRIGAEQAAILSTFELPVTFIFASVFLQEFPQWTQWVGGLLVLAGIITLNLRQNNTTQYSSTQYSGTQEQESEFRSQKSE